MRSSFSSVELAFRDNVRAFLSENLPREIAEQVRLGAGVGKKDLTAWTQILNRRGWAAPNWPKQYGGAGWTLTQRHIFDVECRLAQAPPLLGFGFNMVGPAIIKFGTRQQQQEQLPLILNAERWWCQGYSEPGAGSDLAALSTRAERRGDVYVVNGQKIWTSAAELADWIFCLVRTDPNVKKQQGISFLLLDLNTPGITIEPLIAFNGKRLWNQVFFEDVRVPVSNRLGEENKGWTVAKSLLGDERLLVSRVAENKRLMQRIRDLLKSSPGTAELSVKADMLAIRLQALETTSLRILARAEAGEQIGAEPSILKLKGSELVQSMDELMVELAGRWAFPQDRSLVNPWPGSNDSIGPQELEYIASGYFHHRGYTIAGGSSEIQHNIIAKQILKL